MTARNTPEQLDETIRRRAEVTPEGCHLWTGRTHRQGYVVLTMGGRQYAGHRWIWERTRGPIPVGLVIDHTCHTNDPACPAGWNCAHRRCLNPDHMELVTQAENTRRGGLRRTHCLRGHAYNEVNTYLYRGRRNCRPCIRETYAARTAA